MSTFSWTPDFGSKLSIKPRTLEARFGDGYAQRAANGINTQAQVWTLKFTVSPSEADAIMAFLEAAGGTTPFDWTPPRYPAAKFVCTAWDRDFGSAGLETVNAVFEQDFAP